MRGHDGRDDGQAKTRPSGRPRPGGVRPEETLEKPLGILRFDARPVVANLDDGVFPMSAQSYLDRGAGRRVAENVGEQIRDDLGDLVRIGVDRDLRRGAAVEADDGGGAAGVADPQVHGCIHRYFGQLRVFQRKRAPLVEAGELKKVLDEAAHALSLGFDPVHRDGDLAVRHAADAIELGVAANRGQRSAQLVRGVGDELTHLFLRALLDVEGLLDLLEHDVDGIGELADLGALLALGDAAREVAVGDGVGCALDAAKGLERRTDGKQRRERADDDNRCA